MREKIALLFIAFLAGSSLAEWCETLEVLYLDSLGGPVPDASVLVRYQKNDFNHSDGSTSGVTGADGTLLLGVCDFVPSFAENRTYFVTAASPFGESETRRTKVGENYNITGRKTHYEQFQLSYPVYDVKVRALHTLGTPLARVAITMTKPYSATRTTDANGTALFRVKAGSFQANGSYEGVSASTSNSISKNTEINMTFRIFNNTLLVHVTDLNQTPLSGAEANVSYSGVVKPGVTDENGEVRFEGITVESVFVKIFLKGVSANRTVALKPGFNEANFSIQTSLLSVSAAANPKISQACEQVAVSAEAKDLRVNASEINASINYSFGGRGWREEKMQRVSGGSFSTSISCSNETLPSNFSFKVTAKEAWGEMATPVQLVDLPAPKTTLVIQDASSPVTPEEVQLGFIGYVSKNALNLVLGGIVLFGVIMLLVMSIITLVGKRKKGVQIGKNGDHESTQEIKAPEKPASRSGAEKEPEEKMP